MNQSAKIKRLQEKETIVYPYIYEYKCICGQVVVLHSDVKPKKLEKCWRCIDNDTRHARSKTNNRTKK